MLLSKLVYLSIKNVTYYDDAAFTYESFMEGKFNDDPDYATEINNIFTPINEAIARLSDLERIPYVVEQVNASLIENNVLDFSNLTKEVKQIINVAQLVNYEYEPKEFRPMGANKILIAEGINKSLPVFVEFKEDIPQFSDLSEDFNLREFGINDSVANYIMEYVMGRLSEDKSAELANMHITRAEQYFNNIPANKATFSQKKVAVKFGI